MRTFTRVKFVNWIEKNQPTVYNGLFVFYVIFLQGPFYVASKLSVNEEESFPVFGVIILLVILLETIGLAEKFTALRSHGARPQHKNRSLELLWIVWLGHMVISTFLGMVALSAFGFPLSENSPALILMPVLVVKDLVIGAFMSGITDAPKKSFSKYRELLANLFLFIFVCVAYTATWQALVMVPVDPSANRFESIFLALPVFMLFYLFYIPIRFGFFAEELLVADTKSESRWLKISYLLAGLGGVMPIIGSLII